MSLLVPKICAVLMKFAIYHQTSWVLSIFKANLALGLEEVSLDNFSRQINISEDYKVTNLSTFPRNMQFSIS